MGFIPLTEGGGVDLNNSTFHQGVGTDQLVIRGVVDNGNDTGFASNGFGAPSEVSCKHSEPNMKLC